MRFHSQCRIHSTPSRGIVPQGKGREGIRKGMERNATAIPCVVESEKSQIKVKFCTRPGV